jgi:hypothetical protein
LRACLNFSGVISQNDEGDVIRSKYFNVSSMTQSTYASKY